MMTDEQIFARDKFTCVYCGYVGKEFKTWVFLEVDHFRPKRFDKDGDTHDDANRVTSCCICNRMKGGSDWKDVPEAKKHLDVMWKEMRGFWDKKVEPLVK